MGLTRNQRRNLARIDKRREAKGKRVTASMYWESTALYSPKAKDDRKPIAEPKPKRGSSWMV